MLVGRESGVRTRTVELATRVLRTSIVSKIWGELVYVGLEKERILTSGGIIMV